MGRPELSRYPAEALAALANWGLVKRAARELESGLVPQLEELPQGLEFRFADGSRTFFAEGEPVQAAACSCGASGWCRHRVGALLWLSTQAPAEEAESTPQVDLEKLRQWLGPRLWRKAEQLRRQGMSAELADSPWRVRLPQCDVRLLLPDDVYSLRCSCAQAAPCEHLALAGWVVAECRGQPGRVQWLPDQAPGPRDLEVLDPFLQELLREGCVHAASSWKAWGKKAQQACRGHTWLQILLERLEQLQAEYQQGSALYSPGEWLFCLLSFKARLGADAMARGLELPLEQPLSHVRLMSLGCRLRSRQLVQYWLEPGGQALTQSMKIRPGRSVRDESWGGLGGVVQVASSQLVSRGVLRRANRSLRLRREQGEHSLTPLGQSWTDLSWPGLEVERMRREALPSRLLRPLVEAEEVVVVPLAGVLSLTYAPGPQEVRAWLQDPQGEQWLLQRAHDPGCAGSLDALVEYLPQATHVSGLLRWQQGVACMEPLALLTPQGVRVLDLEEPGSGWELPLVLDELPLEPLQALIQQGLDLCQESAHLGLSQLMPSFDERRRELAGQLAEAGMTSLARALGGAWNGSTFWGAALRCFRASELLEGESRWGANASP